MLKNFKVHRIMITICFVPFFRNGAWRPDALSPVFNPFRTQTSPSVFVLVLHAPSHHDFMLSIPSLFNYLPKSPVLEGCFSHKLILKFHDRRCQVFTGYWKPLSAYIPLPPSCLFCQHLLILNRRYGRGWANERRSLGVHPKVTHLKPTATPGETLPCDYA